MERGDEKLTRSVLSFDEMPINQSLSPVNLSSSLFLPSFLFCPSSLSISHFFVFFFSGSLTLTTNPLFLTLTLLSSLFPHLPHSLSNSPFICLLDFPAASLSLSARSFTCQLGSRLWSSNMTNCPLIHLYKHTDAHTDTSVYLMMHR